MIECIFTLDYEIRGNGTGKLLDLVFEPTERLREVFHKWSVPFVAFIEVLEFEKIERFGADSAIDLVKKQVRELFETGHEIGLHLHPQWCNATLKAGSWVLDDSEYNLCLLSRERISKIVADSLSYLRYLVSDAKFAPTSFRAGNWLFQPTSTAAAVLTQSGIKVDSSVFKGGLQRAHQLDYRPALGNDYYWRFRDDVNKPDALGSMLEIPIYTEMVAPWQMATSKRLGASGGAAVAGSAVGKEVSRIRDLLRFRYPLKFDFCRMTLQEMISMLSRIEREDRTDPALYRPIVAIGHSKDPIDLDAIDSCLSFLRTKDIRVVTLEAAYSSLLSERAHVA